ncbi:hypothetical protein JNB11_04605 [Kocuria palustris]|nr:hypothetical protein [Kocuria palustris]
MESIFTELHQQIEADAANKETLRQIEREFAQDTAHIKLALHLLAAPTQLQVPDHRAELLKLFTTYNDKLKPVVNSDRLSDRFTQELLTLYLTNGYFLEVKRAFASDLDTITINLMDVVVPPAQLIAQGFHNDENVLEYLHYLLSVLTMVDAIVEYTGDAIINVLMEPGADKRQYAIGPANLDIVNKLSTGFGMLDLKNDGIRRKYDGLKYAVKRINGFVYDLLLRGLITVKPEVVESA